MAKVEEYEQEAFDEMKLDPKDFTEEQVRLMMQPEHAPENYHMDGEITPPQAFRFWKQSLRESGLDYTTIRTVVSYNF